MTTVTTETYPAAWAADLETSLGYQLPHPLDPAQTASIKRVAEAIMALDVDIVALIDAVALLDTPSDVDSKIETAAAAAVAGLVDTAPGTLDTLNELAAALGDDPDFAATTAAAIAAAQSAADAAQAAAADAQADADAAAADAATAQATADGKANASHTHSATDITDLTATLDARAAARRYSSAEQTITAGGPLTLAHGLGVKPSLVSFRLKNTSAELGWAVGDEIFLSPGLQHTSANRGAEAHADASSVSVRFGNASQTFNVFKKDDGTVPAAITNANWVLIVDAWVL